MHRRTPRLTHSHQTGRDIVRIILGWGQNFTPIVRRNTAHVVVHSRQYRDRLFRQVHTRKDTCRLGNTRKAQVQRLWRQVVEVQVDVIPLLAHAAPFSNFHRHTAGNNVTRCEVLIGRRITLHEPLAFGVGEVTTFPARTLGNQTACAVNPCRVELHKFHILQRQTRTRGHTTAVTRTGVGRCG